jgi:hypothetical protein
VELLHGAGHLLPLEAPDWVNEQILDFVKGHSGWRTRKGRVTSLLRRCVASCFR